MPSGCRRKQGYCWRALSRPGNEPWMAGSVVRPWRCSCRLPQLLRPRKARSIRSVSGPMFGPKIFSTVSMRGLTPQPISMA